MARNPDSHMIVYGMLREALAADGFVKVLPTVVERRISPRVAALLKFQKQRLDNGFAVTLHVEIRHAGYAPAAPPGRRALDAIGFMLLGDPMPLFTATRPGDFVGTDIQGEVFGDGSTFPSGVAALVERLRREMLPMLLAHRTFGSIRATLRRRHVVVAATGRTISIVPMIGVIDGEGFSDALDIAVPSSRSRRPG